MIFIILGSISGLLIGTVGIGGILLAPMLVYIASMDLHLAMATSSWSFLFAGIAGTIAYARKGTISWKMVTWLSLGLIPAALFGARVNIMLQTGALTIILATLIVLSGLNAIYKKPSSIEGKSRVRRSKLVATGLVTGFGSALTGTGGPVLLLPIFMQFNVPTLVAVGVSQAIQLPIALFASVGFFLFGQVDFQLGVLLGISQAVAVVVGAQIAHRVSAERLRHFVSVTLVAAGLLMIARVLL